MNTHDSGTARQITGASHDPQRRILSLVLECGHSVKIRTDTPLGGRLFESFRQTEWKAWPCNLCSGWEFFPNLNG